MSCRLPLFLLCLALAAPATFAQTKPHSPRKSPPSPWTKIDCGQGIELRLSSPASLQGHLLLAEVRSAHPLADLQAKWINKDVPFWKTAKTLPQYPDVRRAFLGIDLEQAASTYPLIVSPKLDEAAPRTCQAAITVRAGHFSTEKLKVAPNFVKPDPEQLAKAEADRKKLREIFATVTPEKFWQGPFRVPLDGVNIGGNFGRRRVLNGEPSSPHTGVDFPAPSGMPVHAAQRGRVVLAEPLYFSGNTVVVDHGLGVYTLYGHFSEIDVKAGDMVESGALLGKVGATGRVTGPHLHWGLTVNRSRVNALQIVALRNWLRLD